MFSGVGSLCQLTWLTLMLRGSFSVPPPKNLFLSAPALPPPLYWYTHLWGEAVSKSREQIQIKTEYGFCFVLLRHFSAGS